MRAVFRELALFLAACLHIKADRARDWDVRHCLRREAEWLERWAYRR